MQNVVTNSDIPDYVSELNGAMNPVNWENGARLFIGGTLVAVGLANRSKLGLALVALGGGIASLSYLHSEEKPDSVVARRTVPVRKAVIRRAITIGKPQPEVYEFWSRPENLARVFPGVESISVMPEGRWRWRLKPVKSAQLTWDTKAIKSEPPNFMSWKSVPSAPLDHAGSITFKDAPAGRGTEALLTLAWIAKGGVLQALSGVIGKGAGWHASEALRRAKQLLETGELSTAAFA
jgi:uncharacterized membrane protein